MHFPLVVDVLALQVFLPVLLVHCDFDGFDQVHLPLVYAVALDGAEEANLFLCNFNHSLVQCIALQVKQLRAALLFLLSQDLCSVPDCLSEVHDGRLRVDSEVDWRGCKVLLD